MSQTLDNQTAALPEATESWGLPESTVTLLQVFCTDEGKLASPWHCDGWVYATNGRVLVRVRAVGVWGNATGVPSAAQLFDGSHGTAGAEYDVPEVQAETACCKRCCGGGWVECNLGHDHECPDCDGSGEKGSWPLVMVGPRCFYGRNLWLIRHLPGVKLWIDPELSSSIACYVAWDGGEGLISSTEPEEERA
jgi:hypothetical protein